MVKTDFRVRFVTGEIRAFSHQEAAEKAKQMLEAGEIDLVADVKEVGGMGGFRETINLGALESKGKS